MSTDGKILDRIRKLLALARGSTEHEAALAAARAADLMAQHQIAEATVLIDGEPDAIHVIYMDATGQREPARPWVATIAAGVGDATGTKPIWQRVPRGVILQFIGRPGDVDAACYMVRALRADVDRLSAEAATAWLLAQKRDTGWCPRMRSIQCRAAPSIDLDRCIFCRRLLHDPGRPLSSARYRSGWRVGCAVRLAERLRATRAQAMRAAPEVALARLDKVRAAIEAALPDNLERGRPPKLALDEEAVRAGIAAGDRIKLGADAGALTAGHARLNPSKES